MSKSIHIDDAVDLVENKIMSETSIKPNIHFRSTRRRKIMCVSATVNGEEHRFKTLFGGFYINKKSLLSLCGTLIDDIKVAQCSGAVTNISIDRNP